MTVETLKNLWAEQALKVHVFASASNPVDDPISYFVRQADYVAEVAKKLAIEDLLKDAVKAEILSAS